MSAQNERMNPLIIITIGLIHLFYITLSVFDSCRSPKCLYVIVKTSLIIKYDCTRPCIWREGIRFDSNIVDIYPFSCYFFSFASSTSDSCLTHNCFFSASKFSQQKPIILSSSRIFVHDPTLISFKL